MSPAGNWSETLRYFFLQKVLGWSRNIVQKKATTYRKLMPSFVEIRVELMKQRPFKGSCMSPARNWSENLR
jgi:hypothetical protein